MNVRPHVAQNLTRRGGSAIDGRTTGHRGYAASQRIRKRIEEGFGWMKTVAGLDRPMVARYRPGRLGVHLRCGCLQSRAPPQAARGDAVDGAAARHSRRPLQGVGASSRWTPGPTMSLDVGGEAHLSFAGAEDGAIAFVPSRHSSMSATARETGKRLQSSPSRVFRRGRSDLRTWLGQSRNRRAPRRAHLHPQRRRFWLRLRAGMISSTAC